MIVGVKVVPFSSTPVPVVVHHISEYFSAVAVETVMFDPSQILSSSPA
jgi:hypothetical protein